MGCEMRSFVCSHEAFEVLVEPFLVVLAITINFGDSFDPLGQVLGLAFLRAVR